MGPIVYFSASMIITRESQRHARDALERVKVVAEADLHMAEVTVVEVMETTGC